MTPGWRRHGKGNPQRKEHGMAGSSKALYPDELAEALDSAPVSEGFRADYRALLGHLEAKRNPDDDEGDGGDNA